MLTVEASPTTIDPNGKMARITATATGSDGKIGTGSVRFSVDVGTLSAETVPLDGFGRATATYSCDRATNPDCTDRAMVTVRWLSDKTALSETVSIRLVVGSGSGGGGAGAGGSGGTGGFLMGATAISNMCASTARPGLANCCRNPNIATSGAAVPCPALRVLPHSEFDMPFRSASGATLSLRMRWNPAERPPSVATCSQQPPIVEVLDGTVVTFGARMYWMVADDYWETSSGLGTSFETGMSTSNLLDPCGAAFQTPQTVGSALSLNSGIMVRGGVTYNQADDNSYIFLLPNGR